MKHKALLLPLLALLTGIALGDAPSPIPQVKYADQIPDGRPSVRWRGFNLQGMYGAHTSEKRMNGFPEEDFQLIHELGFNFVRIPLDYRYFIKDADRAHWTEFDEEYYKKLDQMIDYGRRYQIHVMLCLHRIPGYTVDTANPEPTDLFSDLDTLKVACLHWAKLANRYKGIPNERLSFNLFNEPGGRIAATNYARVASYLIRAIRKYDPDRYIVADGLGCGRRAVPELEVFPSLGQATRGYFPHGVTHYLAPWAGKPSAKPIWPQSPTSPDGVLGGPGKPEVHEPLVIEHPPEGTLVLKVGMVSGNVTLRIKANDDILQDIPFDATSDGPQWTDREFHPQWHVWQALYKDECKVTLPKPLKKLSIQVVAGDWLRLDDLHFLAPDGTELNSLPFGQGWTHANFTQVYNGPGQLFTTPTKLDWQYPDPGRECIYLSGLNDWDKMVARGTFCFMGEFGVWKKTPHDVAMRLIEDYLKLMKERNMGWALWEFRGTMGILDTQRTDIEYEDFHGHKLDRQLLDLLRKY